MGLRRLIQAISPHKLFLIDSLGALLSVVAGILVAQYENLFGIPPNMMYALVGIACLFFIVSFSCYLRRPEYWKQWMKAIAMANLLYCCLTVGLLIYLYPQLTGYGIAFLVIEMILIVFLAFIELKKAASQPLHPGKI